MPQSTTTTLLTEDNQKLLQSLLESGIIDKTAVESIYDMKNKEVQEAVIAKLGYEPHIGPRDDGRFITKIKVNGKWKQYNALSVPALYQILYDLYFGDANITLEQLFPRFMLYRRDMQKVAPKTILENANDWKKYLQDTDLSKTPMHNLKPKDYIRFFENITKGGKLTSKCVCNIKSLLNKMYAYAIREELVDYNPITSIDFSEFSYYVPDNSNQVYSLENRQKLLTHLRDIAEPYSLAIQFDFQVTCRIGEIKALRWENVDFVNRTITINEQALSQRQLQDDLSFSKSTTEVVPRIKGNTARGKRTLPMTSECMRILMLAKEINPNGDYVFMPHGKIMLTNTFNKYLKKYCKEANVPYFSSHKIRFTSCSTLYMTSNDLTEVSKAMGHSQTATTLHYLRNVTNTTDTLEHMEHAFGVVAPDCTK